MKNTTLCLLSVLGLAELAAGCSTTPEQACGPANCQGCCDAEGACQPSNELTCGSNGATCTVCRTGDRCVFGVCSVSSPGGGGGTTGGGGGTTGGGGGTTGGGGGTTGGGGGTTGGGGGTTGGGGGTTGGGGGTTGGGGGVEPVTCTAPLSACGMRCTDLARDPSHCGACGTSCPGAQLCVNGACVPAPMCDAQRPCPAGAYCSGNGTCLRGCDDALQCPQPGACDSSRHECVCATGKHACGNTCAAADDVTNCGPFCRTCVAPAHSVALCRSERCEFECDSGYHRCGDQCLADTSVNSCGASCSACVPPANASSTCNGVACDFTCNAGYHRCGSACVANTSVGSCGTASCTACVAPTNATSTCNGVACDFTCNAGYHRCGSACVSNTSLASCGASSCTPCSVPGNGAATCNGTSCGFTCNSGHHACGATCASNAATATCGSSCSPCVPPSNATSTCDGASCDFTCNAGFHRCGASCVANTSTSSCGTASCSPCVPPANAVATCNGVSCDFTCNTGFHRCGATCAPNASTTQCGASCAACQTPSHGAPSCVDGACQYECGTGFHFCSDGSGTVECASDSNAMKCGLSCTACPAAPNGTPACANNVCTATCSSGFRQCVGGCTPTNSTVACGSSCTTCPTPANLRRPVCNGTSCATACVTDCGGTCVDALRDESNCGGCGVTCTAGQTCSNGRCGAACASGGLFQDDVPVVWDMGVATQWVAAADFNGDGRADLATSSALRLATANGSFGRSNLTTSGMGVAADLNGDGRADLVVAGSSQLQTFLGTPTGLATPSARLVSLLRPRLVDVNGANGPDLIAISGTSATTVQVMLNDGVGGFGSALSYVCSTPVTDFTLGDVTGDGVPDLVLIANGTTSGTHDLVVVAGNGTGTFSGAGIRSPLLERSDRLELVDVNRDGKLDVLVSSLPPLHGVGPLRSLVNSGTGVFTADTRIFGDTLDDCWAVAEFTGDGIPDLVRSSGSSTWLHPGGATGGFGAGSNVPIFGTPYGLASGDVDGDGDRDLVAINSQGDAEVTRIAGGRLTPPALGSFTSGADTFGELLTGDFNGDGRDDVVRMVGTGIELNLGNGAGGFATGPQVPLQASAQAWVVDDNGDAAKDVLLAGTSLTLLRGSTTGTLTQSWTVPVPSVIVSQAGLHDLDGDGLSDLIMTFATVTAGRTTYELCWVKRLTPTTFATLARIGYGATSFVVADFDGDGRPDLGTTEYDGVSSSRFGVFINQGGGLFVELPSLAGPNFFTSGARVADLNGDAHWDLIFKTSAFVGWATGDGRGQFTSFSYLTTNYNSEAFELVDFDADGAMDVLATGRYGLLYLRNDGTAGFEVRGMITDAEFQDFGLAVGNFDGVGLKDVVLPTLTSDYLLLRGRCP